MAQVNKKHYRKSVFLRNCRMDQQPIVIIFVVIVLFVFIGKRRVKLGLSLSFLNHNSNLVYEIELN